MGTGGEALATAPIVARSASATWTTAATPAASIVVATHNRAGFLPELIRALEAQRTDRYEVVVVDDGSADDTWTVLSAAISRSAAPALAVRLDPGRGPSIARNVGATEARGEWLAFTDDDCLAEPQWLGELLAAQDGSAVVQGRTLPLGDRPGAWARSIHVSAPSSLYETCNLGVRRTDFLAAGGFPVLALLPGQRARGFGEDAALGARMAADHGRVWAERALVRHRWLPGSYRDHIRGQVRLAAFPALAEAVPEVADACWHRVFLSPRTAALDLGMVGMLAGRKVWPLALALPYVTLVRPEARWRAGGRAGAATWRRAGQLVGADLAGFVALLVGSVRARRLLL